MNASATGRPLRWVMIVIALWTGGRIVIQTSWPTEAQTYVGDYHLSRAKFAIAPMIANDPKAHETRAQAANGRMQPIFRHPIVVASQSYSSQQSQPFELALAITEHPASPMPDSAAVPAVLPTPPANTPKRWSLDSWLMWRHGSGPVPLSRSGQLGGSQAGARLQYEILSPGAGRVAAYARLTSALNRPAAPEAAAGISYQPDRHVPFSIAVERRVALNQDARNAFAFYGTGGIGPTAIPLGLKAEGYAQAGIVGFRRRDAFADGKLSIYRPLDHGLSAGVAVSGGAQPHLTRIDIAPELQLRLSRKGSYTKIAAEWRERVAGNARPGSGLTVTVAAGF